MTVSFRGHSYQSDRLVACELMGLFCRHQPWTSYLLIHGNPPTKSKTNSATLRRSVLRAALADCFVEPKSGNIAIACVFYRADRQRVDADNMMKAVMDIATGICWFDDSQVTAQAGFAEFDQTRPRLLVVIGPARSSLRRTGLPTIAIPKTCELCGTEFFSYFAKQRFCSHRCRNGGFDLMDLVPCPACGVLFKRKTSTQQLCSNACRGKIMGDRRRTRGAKPDCRSCGKPLSRHGYILCRACWLGSWRRMA